VRFFAFAAQMPLGVVADKLDRNYLFAFSLGVAALLSVFPNVPLAGVASALLCISLREADV